MIRILIVDDQKSVRETLITILGSETDFEIVATANDGQNARKLAKKLLPDLMIVDLEMPKLNGLDLTQLLQQELPQIKVVVLSIHDQDEWIQKSLQAGAMGYLLKNTPPPDLKEAIRLIARGYTQFSPGLLHRVIPSVTSTTSTSKNQDYAVNLAAQSSDGLKLVNSNQSKPRRIRKSWKFYLPYWLAGNAVLWGLAIFYLLFTSPIYTSRWSISLPSNKNSSNVSIPDVGSVSSHADSPYHTDMFDPRENYKYLLGKEEVLLMAAAKAGMKKQEFGEPEVSIIDNTTMMEISMEGETPEAAQQKAIALQAILKLKLDQLRQAKISQSDQGLQTSLEKSELALQNARQKLADFRAKSAIGSRDKLGNLSTNLEDLRRQQSEVKAQLNQANATAQRLADSLGISSQSAKDAFALHSDSLFQQHLSEYTRLSGELISIQSRFHDNNPVAIDKKTETEAARRALLQRGAILLGRSTSPEVLQQLNLRAGDENDSYRGSLLKDIVSLQSEAEGLAGRSSVLEQQLAKLDAHENSMVQQQSTFAELEQEVKFAETVYSSNLAKSRLAESNLYNAYPQIQVAIQPNFPREPSSPNTALVCLGTFMGSVFLTTAIASLWASSTEEIINFDHNHSNQNGNNHKALSPAASLNSILKK